MEHFYKSQVDGENISSNDESNSSNMPNIDSIIDQFYESKISILYCLQTLNSLYSSINYSLSLYIPVELLFETMIPDSCARPTILEFYCNIISNITNPMLDFFTTENFMGFMTHIFENESSSQLLEYSFLVIRNLLVQAPQLLELYLKNNLLAAMTKVPDNNDLIVIENKVEALSIFLLSDLSQFPEQEYALLTEVFQNYFIKTKFDHIKVLSIKLFKHAFASSTQIFVFLSQKEFLDEMISIFQNYRSKRLCRHALHLLINLIGIDEKYVQFIVQSDVLFHISSVMHVNEDRCSSLVLDLLQLCCVKGGMEIVSYDHSHFLCFEKKGYTAKKRFVSFLFTMCSLNDGYLESFEIDHLTTIINIIDDVMQSNDENLYRQVIHFYLSHGQSLFAQYILPFLIENLEFCEFLQDAHETSDEIELMFQRMNQLHEADE